MISDLKLALRQLAKSPGFALTAIITLALGIGANAVVFSVLNSLILKPLNVPGGQNLYTVQRFQYPSHSYPDYLDMRDRNRSFESLIAFQIMGPVGVDTGGHPSVAWPYMSSGNYFDALQVQPYLGRFFHASDEKGENSAPYVVLSYAYWHSYFHGDPHVIGRQLAINKHPFTIIGVAQPSFRGTELFFAPDVWIPMVEDPIFLGNFLKNRGDHSIMLVGRLRPGVTPAMATADLNTIGAWLAKAYPSENDGVKFTLARPGLIGDMLEGPARAFMAGLMLLAGLILLAACANLGSLFAARASDRAKEVALRLALGSRRGLIVRQLLTEALLISVAGGAIGLGGGVLILHLLGFEPQGTMLAAADLHMGGYDGDRMPQMQRRMLDSISAIPGVSSVGYVTRPPLSIGSGDSFVYTDATMDFRPTNVAADAMVYNISAGYIQAAGTHLLAGRDLAFSDDKSAPKVALINRTFAIKVFGSIQKAIGGHFKYWGSERAQVVGVVEDGKYRTLTEDQMPAMFLSFLQYPRSDTTFVVRTARDPQEMNAALQRTLSAIDPSLPLVIRPWNAELDWALFSARIATIALGILGLLGAMLAVTGIFGMASYVVSKRLRELGIRVALGASSKQILGASLSRAFRLLAIGSIAGIVLGLLATRVLGSIVYQATPKDPLVLAGVTLTMLLLGMLAALLPARRALSVDPLILLRDQ
jgi:hypothetical protein